MKRILVTGASGFIGNHCVPLLLPGEWEVHAVYMHSSRVTSSGVHWHRADLLDPKQLQELMANVQPSHLLHLAWDVTPGIYWESTDNLRWLQASIELLRLFHQHHGRRVVMVGTCAEYDWRSGICKENITALLPGSLYAACKHSLQTVLAAFAGQNGISAVWGRIFFLYGPHERGSERLVPSVIRSLVQGKEARCSNGRQRRDFLYVKDVAAALVSLLNSDTCGPINICSGEGVAVKEIVSKIADRIGRPDLIRFGTIPLASSEPDLIVGDVGRLSREVGWSPQFTLEEGLDETICWWKEQMLTVHS
jgi:nucleoside-diphosphate-sugar epimerase